MVQPASRACHGAAVRRVPPAARIPPHTTTTTTTTTTLLLRKAVAWSMWRRRAPSAPSPPITGQWPALLSHRPRADIADGHCEKRPQPLQCGARRRHEASERETPHARTRTGRPPRAQTGASTTRGQTANDARAQGWFDSGKGHTRPAAVRAARTPPAPDRAGGGRPAHGTVGRVHHHRRRRQEQQHGRRGGRGAALCAVCGLARHGHGPDRGGARRRRPADQRLRQLLSGAAARSAGRRAGRAPVL